MNKILRLLSIGLYLTLTTISHGASDPTAIKIKIAQATRSYYIHLPSHFDQTQSYPLVMAFHGGGGNGKQFMNASRWNAKSNKENFIVVYPNGTGRFKKMLTWNVETCCGWAQKKNSNDVAFIDALLDDLIKQYLIDAKRVYATGMSNGAMISYRLACELPHRITAIAPVAGTLMSTLAQDARKVPVLHIHGTADQNVPFNGGVGSKSIVKINFTSVQKSLDTWIKHNGCKTMPTVTNFLNTTNDGMINTRTIYANNTAPVELITIQGGGHSWPGSPAVRRKQKGQITADFHAEDVIWDFFKRFTMTQ